MSDLLLTTGKWYDYTKQRALEGDAMVESGIDPSRQAPTMLTPDTQGPAIQVDISEELDELEKKLITAAEVISKIIGFDVKPTGVKDTETRTCLIEKRTQQIWRLKARAERLCCDVVRIKVWLGEGD